MSWKKKETTGVLSYKAQYTSIKKNSQWQKDCESFEETKTAHHEQPPQSRE